MFVGGIRENCRPGQFFISKAIIRHVSLCKVVNWKQIIRIDLLS